jgi:Bacteriophage related domain of unknown function
MELSVALKTETQIIQCLFAELTALALTPSLPIALPGANFTPPADDKWLRANDLPAVTQPFAITPGGARDYSGSIQVDVIWPLGSGVTAAKEIAGAIIEHFEPTKPIFGDGLKIKIVRSSVGTKVDDGARFFLPVTIQYRAFA